MNYGKDEIGKVYYGGVEIDKIYHGSDLVYEAAAPHPYPVGTVVLEKTGATNDWVVGGVEILGDGIYDAILVAPGAGGASGKWTYVPAGGTVQARQGCASGGAGGVFIGKLKLKKGVFSYQIPPNGKGVDMKNATTVSLGDLLFGDLFLSGAQGGNKSGSGRGYPAGGRGGQRAMNSQDDGTTVIVETTTNENGADGTSSTSAATIPNTASAYGQYGFGGGAMYSTDSYTYNDGGVGYIKIVYAGQ